MQAVAKHRSDRGISWEKSNIGYFHHFVADGRHRRLIATLDDVFEPITIVLNESGVTVRKRPFRREKANRHRDLHESEQ